MNIGARLFMILLGLIAAAAGLLGLAIAFELLALPGWGISLSNNLEGSPLALAAGAGLLIAAFLLLVSGLRAGRKPAPDTVLQTSALGEIRIAILAMENMVLRVVQQTQGVRDGGRFVYQSNDGLVVKIKIKVMPDLELPGLVAALQLKVKEYLEQITGFVVHEVKVVVENIILDQAPAKKLIRPN
ncbi:MAG: alkaline shock response membrane anchor protein AmaP [Dethiobacter sp.]|jgi:uncharacterized alkaline shock family protein YloU|nr:alkaline shock response membrane anchor protein AmaP [Dethiobacter sp.]